MKLVVSNIAWTNEEEPEVAQLLQRLGIRYVEIAPTKTWDDPTAISQIQIDNYVKFWGEHGIKIVAIQSMLFNRPDLKIFEGAENRAATLKYLQKFIGTAGDFGASTMVFGSPKNRQRGSLSLEGATKIAKPFFDQLGSIATENKTNFCIEPNALQYACDFITTAQEGIDFVQAVNNPGLRLHLDIACMTLAGDDAAKSIISAAPYLQHFHISSPMLDQVEAREDVKHEEAAEALRSIGYDNYVSIEMRPGPRGVNAERVKLAVIFAQSIYSS